MQIEIPQANALKSIGYMDTILFLTIGKPDQHKSLGNLETVFYSGDLKLPKLAAYIPNLFCDRYPAYQYPATVHVVGKSTVSAYPTDFRCICKLHSYLHWE
jgi:hypothetical protein